MVGQRAWALAALLWLSGCSGSDAPAPPPLEQPAPPDAGSPAGDGGIPDAGGPDAGAPDAGQPDGGGADAGTPDAGAPDAGPIDAGAPDAGTQETGASLEQQRFEGAVQTVAVEADAAGNAYLLVRYEGTARFQDRVLPDDGSGNAQHALLKLDAQRRLLWAQGLPSGGCIARCEEGAEVRFYRIAAWPDGHVALAANFRGPLVTPLGRFEGTTDAQEEFRFTSLVLARLTPEGEWLWARELRAEQSIDAVDVDVAGAFVAVSGIFKGASAQLGAEGGFGMYEVRAYVARFGADGTLQAAHDYRGERTAFGRGVAVAEDGRVWAVGYLGNTGRFDPYFVQLGADGQVAWERLSVGVQLLPEELTRAADGTLVAEGRANSPGTLRWAGREVRLDESRGRDLLLAFGPGGEERWAQLTQGVSVCKSLDAQGSAFVTFAGRAFDPVDLGGGPRGTAERNNLVVARFRVTDGAHVWSEARTLEADERLTNACLTDVALLPTGGEALVAAYLDGLFHVVPRTR